MARRNRILHEQRQALRTWAHQQHPRPSQKACIEWFRKQFGSAISQSTVSESLSSHFEAIDTNKQLNRSRIRTGHWPELETLLFQWQQRIEQQGGLTSGDILRHKAQQLWRQLPQYAELSCPEFSSGWLQRFKTRYNILEHTRHGELGSVPETAEGEMRAIRTLAGEYKEEDIYNMDETGLFWRMTPSRGLATHSQPGRKKDKTRISLVFAVNASGSDRLPVWIIGKYKTPRALRNISVSTMGGEWRWNSKAWMNTQVMCLELTPPPPNIRICWLPPNSTSRFQPLDQGIIQSFKSYYRRQWLEYMLDCYDQGQDPTKLTNLHLAIRWIVRSWNYFISDTTIYNCFRKSTLVTIPIGLPIAINAPDITSLYERVGKAGNIQDIMAISNFLNPIEEQELEEVELDSDLVLQEIISEHLGIQEDHDDEEEDEGQSQKPQYSVEDAIQALQVVIEFTEGCDHVQTGQLRAIERLEQEFKVLVANKRVQTTLDGWIM